VPIGTKLTNFQTPPYSYVIPDTLLTGNYTLVGFSQDRSGIVTKDRQAGLPFTVVDGQKPMLTFLARPGREAQRGRLAPHHGTPDGQHRAAEGVVRRRERPHAFGGHR
jgi:hypothetical protein